MLCYSLNVGRMSKIEQTELLALIDRLDNSSLAYLSYRQGDVDLVLAKDMPQAQSNPAPAALAAGPVITEESIPSASSAPEASKNESLASRESKSENSAASSDTASGESVTSPIVGVVYLQPKPGEPPYVKVGDKVEAGQTVCIVEAMKMMNEIPAPVSGTVTEISVEDEQVVEYNQVLIKIQA